MDFHRHHWIGYVAVLGVLFLLMGCGSQRAYLIVDYQVPAQSQQLQGQRVRLQVTDSRSDPYILSPAVARQFEGFQDRYSLAWVTTDKKRTIVGEHDLMGLFQAAFQKRLEALGVTVVAADQYGAPLFQVDLHGLKVDQKDRDWVAQMSYTASLSKDNMLIASETVKGSAQRTKIIGRKGADQTLSDIFSDIINRLDVVSLFKKAELI